MSQLEGEKKSVLRKPASKSFIVCALMIGFTAWSLMFTGINAMSQEHIQPPNFPQADAARNNITITTSKLFSVNQSTTFTVSTLTTTTAPDANTTVSEIALQIVQEIPAIQATTVTGTTTINGTVHTFTSVYTTLTNYTQVSGTTCTMTANFVC